MLEPIMGPRVGQLLNLLGMLAAGAITFLSATVTSSVGVVPTVILAPLLAIGFAARLAGTSVAASNGAWTMSMGYRGTSWVFFGLAAALLGVAGAVVAVAIFGAFVVLDGVAGYAKRDKSTTAQTRRRIRWARVLVPAAAFAYLGGVAAFHVFVASWFPFGTLLTWTLLALGFSIAILLGLRGPRAEEDALHAPPDHRRHERRVEDVVDPHRARADDVLGTFTARGDAGPFLSFVREAARDAGLPPDDAEAMTDRIRAAFGRAGTDRREDVRAALDEVERLLSLRNDIRETTP